MLRLVETGSRLGRHPHGRVDVGVLIGVLRIQKRRAACAELLACRSAAQHCAHFEVQKIIDKTHFMELCRQLTTGIEAWPIAPQH